MEKYDLIIANCKIIKDIELRLKIAIFKSWNIKHANEII